MENARKKKKQKDAFLHNTVVVSHNEGRRII
jgi:hypothetical protein